MQSISNVQIVLFNGPPRSGKDTAAAIALHSIGPRGIPYRFASPIKNAIHSLFGMSGFLEENFNDTKDEPCEDFFGMTPRQAYIWLSEEVAKPKFGNNFFSKIAANFIKRNAGNRHVVVISDCGFQTEIDTLVEEFGAKNIHLVSILRDTSSFQNDSRSYVDHIAERSYVLNNNGTMKELQEAVKYIMGEILNAEFTGSEMK